jgi:two-component system NarL family sensor kinase
VARIEHERKRISREIHDGIIQLLGSVKFRLESFKRDSNQSDVSQMADLERSLELLQTTITDLRRLCFEMRPSLIDQVGLMTAMNSLIEDFEKGTNIVVIADFDFEDQILNEAQSLALFRIFQELLRNSERHSDATEITMDIFKKDSFIHMEVGDNGKGEIIQNNGLPWRIGMGLINIQERVRTIDGSVEFSSSKGEGFQVKVKIPIAMDQTGVEYGTSSLSTGR